MKRIFAAMLLALIAVMGITACEDYTPVTGTVVNKTEKRECRVTSVKPFFALCREVYRLEIKMSDNDIKTRKVDKDDYESTKIGAKYSAE